MAQFVILHPNGTYFRNAVVYPVFGGTIEQAYHFDGASPARIAMADWRFDDGCKIVPAPPPKRKSKR